MCVSRLDKHAELRLTAGLPQQVQSSGGFNVFSEISVNSECSLHVLSLHICLLTCQDQG